MNLKNLLDWRPFGSVPQIDPAELTPDELQRRFLIIDVRSASEWHLSHIQNSHNLPIQRFSLSSERFSPTPDKAVLCICLSAHRSTPAVRKLRAAGIEAYELKGGMLRWWRLGLPTESRR